MAHRPQVLPLAVLVAVLTLAAAPARAHWCDDNWGSSYNIVVRPETDTVTVPASGAVTLNLDVQNYTGEPFKNFDLQATASGYTIAIAKQAPKVPGYLMPGEKQRYTLSISKSGGGSLAAASITYAVSFGEGAQSQYYGNGGGDVVVKKTDGSVVLTGAGSIPAGNEQARHLTRAAISDFGTTSTGLDNLMQEYCSGRGSWDHNATPNPPGGLPFTTYCPTTSGTTCPSPITSSSPSKYDYQKLWALAELVARKASLGARIPTIRERLKCGKDDTEASFQALAIFAFGYLGPDAAAQTWLEGRVTGGSGDEPAFAKAALLAMGVTTYHADVVANASSSSFHVSAVSAAALGIADKAAGGDAYVEQQLLPKATWEFPEGAGGNGLFAARLLELVAFDRRGWAPNAGDTGVVSFYEAAAPDTTAPRAPANVTCMAQTGGTVRVSWTQVSQDVNGGPESVSQYNVYSGNTARPGGVTKPGDAGDPYVHNDQVNGQVYRNFPALDGTQTYYFAVTATDPAGNASVYSAEVSCVPRYAPVAHLTCDTTAGAPPLTVTCNSNTSTDPNGAGDITATSFSLDGAAGQAGPTWTHTFAADGGHTLQLTVTDSTGLTARDQVTISVSSGGNAPPVAVATAAPTSGQAPLTVTFDGSGSSDADTGQTLSYSWDFKDGSAAATSQGPTHTFQNAGVYDVVLTVTDDGTPPISSTAVVTVEALGNSAPDLTTASAAPVYGAVPLTLHFDATGVTDPEGNGFTLTWDFGDGTPTSAQAQGDHVYGQAGTFTLTLSAKDDGTPDVPAATKTWTVTPGSGPPTNHAPDCATATVTPLSGPPPLTVSLDASGCTDADGNNLTFHWRIPTSVTTEDSRDTAVADYTFTEKGQYVVRLHVSDDAATPMETTREFTIQVGGGRAVSGGCSAGGGAAGAGAGALAGLLVLGVLAVRRRRG
ncbi:MAG TPA: PKD domain-containing protein [Polyangia bacterium]|jgi:MYXO-CTERM domain-containing protein